MDTSKDYYSILGVLPDAEDIVIKAAYKALVNRFHPDKWASDPHEAHRRTVELNEAYDVLSDPVKRYQYDQQRSPKKGSYENDETLDDSFDSEVTRLEECWTVAVEIYPDLAQIKEKLAKTAHRLAFAFMVMLIETKKYQERGKIADAMEQAFLERYFGTDSRIILYAKELISFGYKDAIKGLNRYVDVMGSDVPAELIIKKIEEQYSLSARREQSTQRTNSQRISDLIHLLRSYPFTSEAFELASLLGYKIHHTPGGLFSADHYSVTRDGQQLFTGNAAWQITKWVRQTLVQ